MPFIGQQPITGAYSKLDAITASATATYNLLLNGGAYSPASANHLLVSLNGVMQAPQDSFTVSGSTIIFDSALTSSDNIDFIMALGDVLNVGTPTDGTVSTAKIATDAVTSAKIAANAVTTAKIANDAITNAKIGAAAVNTTELGTGINLTGKIATGHETLSSHVVARSFSAVGYTTGGSNVTLGYLDIPGPGIWKYEAQLRIRWGSNAYFQKAFLSTTDNSLTGEIYRAGGGANTAVRMMLERVTVNSFGNLLLTPSWIIDVPTGLTSGDRVYLIVQPSAGDGQALNNNDANGQPGAHAVKIAETTTSGTTITARSF